MQNNSCNKTIATRQLHNDNCKTTIAKLSQQRALTEGGLEFKAANQCSDLLDPLKKPPDAYNIEFRLFPVAGAAS